MRSPAWRRIDERVKPLFSKRLRVALFHLLANQLYSAAAPPSPPTGMILENCPQLTFPSRQLRLKQTMNLNKICRLLIALGLTSSIASSPIPTARATTLAELSDRQLVEFASAICYGTITDMESFQTDDGFILTAVDVDVIQWIKPERYSKKTHTFYIRGGEYDNIVQSVHGEPNLRIGQSLVAFLEDVPRYQRPMLLGLAQGAFIQTDAMSRELTDGENERNPRPHKATPRKFPDRSTLDQLHPNEQRQNTPLPESDDSAHSPQNEDDARPTIPTKRAQNIPAPSHEPLTIRREHAIISDAVCRNAALFPAKRAMPSARSDFDKAQTTAELIEKIQDALKSTSNSDPAR